LENPRGMLRNILGEPGKVLPGITTYYAAWGMSYLKPTDLWGELPIMSWPLKPRCRCEKGVQNLSGAIKRAVVPYELGNALRIAIENDWLNKR